jgi:hypothetical protein
VLFGAVYAHEKCILLHFRGVLMPKSVGFKVVYKIVNLIDPIIY